VLKREDEPLCAQGWTSAARYPSGTRGTCSPEARHASETQPFQSQPCPRSNIQFNGGRFPSRGRQPSVKGPAHQVTAAATVLLGRDSSCCYCLVSHLLLKRCFMTPGFAKVEMSPRSWSFLAIFLNIRLVIFPVTTAMKGKQESGSLQRPQQDWGVPRPVAPCLPWCCSPLNLSDPGQAI